MPIVVIVCIVLIKTEKKRSLGSYFSVSFFKVREALWRMMEQNQNHYRRDKSSSHSSSKLRTDYRRTTLLDEALYRYDGKTMDGGIETDVQRLSYS